MGPEQNTERSSWPNNGTGGGGAGLAPCPLPIATLEQGILRSFTIIMVPDLKIPGTHRLLILCSRLFPFSAWSPGDVCPGQGCPSETTLSVDPLRYETLSHFSPK